MHFLLILWFVPGWAAALFSIMDNLYSELPDNQLSLPS